MPTWTPDDWQEVTADDWWAFVAFWLPALVFVLVLLAVALYG